ncbi:MAG: hypothetical protein WBD95_02720 [Xanthobacteraceae bacterium]
MKIEEIIRTGLSRVDTIRVVRTAINPLLWLVGLTTPLAFVLAALIGDLVIRLLLICFAAVPVIVTLVAYVIFMFRDPDRLQSEEYASDSAHFKSFTEKARAPTWLMLQTR